MIRCGKIFERISGITVTEAVVAVELTAFTLRTRNSPSQVRLLSQHVSTAHTNNHKVLLFDDNQMN